MSSANVTNPTKGFTWASVASGRKNQTQAELEANRTKEREEAIYNGRKFLEEQQQRLKQREIANRLVKQQQNQEIEREKSKRAVILAEQEKAREECNKRENGWWVGVKTRQVVDVAQTNTGGWTCYRRLDVPKNVNERAMDFIEQMLVNYPEVTTTCKTVGEFKQVFMDAYIGYALGHYLLPAEISTVTTRAEQYAAFQRWVASEEAEYKKASASFRRNQSGFEPTPPWVRNKKWVFGKNVNFENCLWAMNTLSKTFEMEEPIGAPHTGFVQITGNPHVDSSRLTWLNSDLGNYKGIPHTPKPVCRQKQAILDKESQEAWDDFD